MKDLKAFRNPNESEDSLISSCLFWATYPEDGQRITDVMDVEDFSGETNRIIYRAILHLVKNNVIPDSVAICSRLNETNELQKIGGAATIVKYIEEIPLAANVKHHCEAVKKAAKSRKSFSLSKKLSEAAFSEDLDSISQITQELAEMNNTLLDDECTDIGSIVSDRIVEIEERREEGGCLPGVETGFLPLDGLLMGLRPGNLYLLAARPGMGKTALAIDIARNVAFNDHSVLFFSIEMTKAELADRMLSERSGIDNGHMLSGRLTRYQMVKLNEGGECLGDLPLFIDKSWGLTPRECLRKARRVKMRKGLDLIIVDYLQYMRSGLKTERQDLEISEISRGLKGIATELNIPVLALSQLNRKSEGRAPGNRKPMLSDLRDSGALEQDAYAVMFIYRESFYDDKVDPSKAEILVAKNRGGRIGTIELKFVGECTTFKVPHSTI